MRHWIMILSAFLSINLGAQNVKKVYVKVIDTSGIGGSVADTNYIVGQLDIIRGELADTAALLRSDIADSLAITEALLRSDIADSLANMVTDNIYIADGTLTGNREISSGGYNLSFTGGGDIGIGTSSPDAALDLPNIKVARSAGDDDEYMDIYVQDRRAIFHSVQDEFSGTSGGFQFDLGGAIGTDDAFHITKQSDMANPPSNSLFMVDASGNVGIGTSSPSSKLHVDNGSTGTAVSAFADDFIVENSGASTGISILSDDNKYGTVYFGSPSNNTNSFFQYQHNLGAMQFGTNNAGDKFELYTGANNLAMTVDASGKVGIGTSSLDAKLHVQDASSGIISRFQGTDFSQIRVIANTGNRRIIGEDGSGNIMSQIQFTSTDRMDFYGSTAIYMTLNAGNLGIGTVSPSVELDVIGDIEYTGTITDVSDERLKENFAPIDSALQKVIAINPTLFTMKGSDRIESGYKAQNVQEHFSHVVKEVDEAGTLGLDYTQMISLLHQAIKDQQVLIDSLEARIEQLENQ